jgi:DNA mismatch repair protein MLH3
MSMTALASAAELGCLEISSRTAKSRETWSIIVKGGSCLYSGPAVRWRRESSGTVVCVRDAFYNVSAFVKVFWTPHH